ncbi:piRNA biogenesis protein EXD1 [Salarias fasciatus]|uniref:piRNA biogenesis protein EXD1 n=1 Tax=Salarias fasciatus TaxID=181472 RepID=UPI0011766358|nr:piRNA biogenesis protein EXD1 [Salarias fasciatus]
MWLKALGMDHIQFMNLLKGKRISLTVKSLSYSGVVQRVSPDKTLLLSDVSDSNGCKSAGDKLFIGQEIMNGEFLHADIEDVGDEEAVDLEIIDEFIQKFGPAVLHIKKQRVIGVGAAGVEMYRNGRLCWLLIATKYKVYFFDVLQLGTWAFKNGLSMILESRHILKVIHDCRSIAGCLISQFGVKLANVFDTQVADVLCFRSETGGFLPDRLSTLEETLRLRLKVPPDQLSSIQTKSQLTKEEQEVWYTRPCPAALLKPMGLSVIHLLPLRMQLMDDLMTDCLLLVDCYLNTSHYLPDEMEHASPESMLELPRELKQLEPLLQERQKLAAEQYPVTEQGLLARFQQQPECSSEVSPAAEDQNGTLPKPSNTQACRRSPPSVNGRGRPGEFINITCVQNKAPAAPAFPFIGRGFLLHMPPAQGPGWSAAAPPAPRLTARPDPEEEEDLGW